MAVWDKISSRGNVQDRRAVGPGMVGGLGVTGLVVFLLLNFLSGGDVTDVMNELPNLQLQPAQNYNAEDFAGADSYEVFAATVLGSTNDLWGRVFNQANLTYEPPTLVLFRGNTNSACGGADSRVGPHYCPLDETIYLDETFFDELTRRFGAEGGDVAEAYVIAHEVGHHVQEQLNGVQDINSNAESVEVELQADCYAGLWAYSIKDLGVFELGEIKEALDAASAVGDDRIQARVNGRIDPESWTHGSSEQRVEAFNKGFTTGSVANCRL
jgi:uncharacterized protein